MPTPFSVLKNLLQRGLPFLLLLAAPVLAKPVLTVYTYDSFAAEWGPGPAIKTTFEKTCACELNFVALEDGAALLTRLRMEGKNSRADIVLGLDNNLLQAAKQTGLFVPHRLDVSALSVPGGWQDDTFVPYDYGYFAFVYDKNRLPNPPRSLRELVEGPHPWKVIYQDPRTSTPGLGLLLWMQRVFGDDAPQAWRKLAARTVTVTKGWSEAYGLFMKGEADLVLSYTTSPAYHIIEEKKDNYAAASFSEGHYLQVEVAGLLAASKQPQLARQFLQFMLTPAFQQIIPTTNWMYPAIRTPLPEGFAALPVPETALQYSAEQVAEQRGDWIRAWLASVSR